MKRGAFIYLSSYLTLGGIGFAFFPQFTLDLFFSNGEYGDIMPRVAGMFMVALGGLVGCMAGNNDLRYYNYSVFIRTAMTAFIIWLYTITADPLFITILVIVLIGLIPSWYFLLAHKN